MLSLDDERWRTLEGGYRMPFDPRPWLERLATGKENDVVWHEFWEELHHQGDVGVASYATVLPLVQIYRQLGVFDGIRTRLSPVSICAEQSATTQRFQTGSRMATSKRFKIERRNVPVEPDANS